MEPAASDAAPRATPLRGAVCVVTGATRGAGRAIAEELGAGGAVVYVTGRSTRAGGSTEGLPGTVEEAAEAVAARGGEGVAVRCDHTVEADVAALADRVAAERGGLDVLVNNAWGGYEGYDDTFTAPFWEQPASRWDGMFTAGVRAQWLTARALAPLLIARATASRPGLVVATVAWAFGGYLGNLVYDAAKAAIIRMAAGMALELRPHGVAAVALAPGFMRTERVMAVHARQPFDLSGTESTSYVARAVAALAADPSVMARSGDLLTAGGLAAEYGFTDADGRRPPPFRLPDAPPDGGAEAAQDR